MVSCSKDVIIYTVVVLGATKLMLLVESILSGVLFLNLLAPRL